MRFPNESCHAPPCIRRALVVVCLSAMQRGAAPPSQRTLSLGDVLQRQFGLAAVLTDNDYIRRERKRHTRTLWGRRKYSLDRPPRAAKGNAPLREFSFSGNRGVTMGLAGSTGGHGLSVAGVPAAPAGLGDGGRTVQLAPAAEPDRGVVPRRVRRPKRGEEPRGPRRRRRAPPLTARIEARVRSSHALQLPATPSGHGSVAKAMPEPSKTARHCTRTRRNG
eukprot:gene15544-biopygen18722